MGFIRRIFGRDVDSVTNRDTGRVLTADATTVSGVKWAPPLPVPPGAGQVIKSTGNTEGDYDWDADFDLPAPTSSGQILAATGTNVGDYAWMDTTGIATRVTTLSGSGNYTVPAGLTQLVVVMQGGSTGKGRAQATSGYGQFAFYMDSVAGEVIAKRVNVTPGQVIAYSVGVGGLVDVVGNGGAATLEETISASSSTFGGLEAKINCPRYGYSAGVYATEANTTFVSYQERYDRRFETIDLGFVTGTSANSLAVGDAGSIHLFY